jgi:hypothetical protein
MSTTTTAITASQSATQSVTRTRVPSWRSGLATGVVAATATTATVLVMRAVGVPLEVGGEPIPLLGFAQMVLLGTIIGIVMARRLGRASFIRATVVLTAASCIPSVALGTGVDSKLGLVVTHVIAAAIVVPWFARQLSD